MTLDEAIIHAESESWKNEREADRCLRHGGSTYEEKAKSCKACAEEHRQLAEWLTELKERRAKDEPKTQMKTQNSNLTFKTLEYCDICDHKGCEECIANALDEHCMPSHFKKQIEDECAKEYEELGLKELSRRTWKKRSFPAVNSACLQSCQSLCTSLKIIQFIIS